MGGTLSIKGENREKNSSEEVKEDEILFTDSVTYKNAGTPPMALFVVECVYHRTECNLHLYKLFH